MLHPLIDSHRLLTQILGAMPLTDEEVSTYRDQDERKHFKMSFAEVLDLIREGAEHGDTFYVRWSKSITLDRETGCSVDHASGSAHAGLSACEIEDTFASDDVLFEEKAIKQTLATLTRYYFKGQGSRGWVLSGVRRGFDSDGMSLINSDSIEVWGYLDQEEAKKWKAFSRDEDAELSDYFDVDALKKEA